MLNKRLWKVSENKVFLQLEFFFLWKLWQKWGGKMEENVGGNKIRETNNLLKTFNQFIWKDVTNLDVHWSFFQLLLLLLLHPSTPPHSFTMLFFFNLLWKTFPTHQSFKWEFLRNKDFSFSFCLGFSSPHFHSHHDTQGNSPFEWRNIIILKYLHTYCSYTSCHKQKERKCIFLRWKCKSFFLFLRFIIFFLMLFLCCEWKIIQVFQGENIAKLHTLQCTFFLVFFFGRTWYFSEENKKELQGSDGLWSVIDHIIFLINIHNRILEKTLYYFFKHFY